MSFPRWLVPWKKATDQNAVTPIRDVYQVPSKFGWIVEAFGGAWQRGLVVESAQNILAFSAVYACVSLIADDISKLRIKLVQNNSGIWPEVTDAKVPFLAVLRKPNRYQTRIQFLSNWIMSLLLHGNTYVLKERDGRGLVVALYVLDPCKIQPAVAADGEVYYQIHHDNLSGAVQGMISSSEIIHDRMITPWHPLCGVSPIYACGASATQGIRIQANSEKFFANMSRPGGHLSYKTIIPEEEAKRLKSLFEQNYGGANIGRLMVTGNDATYAPMAIPPQDAQLIEQQKWTVEDVARAFHVPLHKIGMTGANQTFTNVGALNQDYYSQTLQARIEAIELLLDEGLELNKGKDHPEYGVELDLEGLLRMDPSARATSYDAGIKAGYLTPNEARRSENLSAVAGGDTPYLQQQNYSLAALAKRDAKDDPFAMGPKLTTDSAKTFRKLVAQSVVYRNSKPLRHPRLTIGR